MSERPWIEAGRRMRAARKAAGRTMGDEADLRGISVTEVSDMEMGRVPPPDMTVANHIADSGKMVQRIYNEARKLAHGVEGWDAFYALLIHELRAPSRVWEELSSIVGCSSVSGDAELDQVRLAYEQRATLEAKLKAAEDELARLREGR